MNTNFVMSEMLSYTMAAFLNIQKSHKLYSDFLMLPLTGFVIGYFTNWLAIKLLFWPKQKVFGLQGLIPKRKEQIAESLSSSYLQLSPKKLSSIFKLPFIGEKIQNYIKREVSLKVKEMPDEELELIIRKAVRKEFFFIEISGGVLGFIIGLIEALLISLAQL